MCRYRKLFFATVFCAIFSTVLFARNIDLVTLPPREKVQLTIYNSEDLTLVKETRAITLKKGVNRLQFSWANTLIDPTSVYFRPLEHESEIDVLDSTFPADRKQVLIWNIESKFEGQIEVEVSYFTSGISWSADYIMVTNPEETMMNFDGYVTVVNNSGEEYENAEIRLVVGVVNLVEKIAQLAGIAPVQLVPDDQTIARENLRTTAMKQALDEAETCSMKGGGPRMEFKAPPKIVKEGLSEYFIFSVEGSHNIRNGWAQRMVSFRTSEVPFEILYRFRAHQYGERPLRFFILANDKEHKLGESPLPDGAIRVLRDNGRDGLAYFTMQTTKYIPLKEKIELNVGTDDQIVYEKKVLNVQRKNFSFESGQYVIGWDETKKINEEIRNYRPKPIKMEFRHVLSGDIEVEMEDPPKLFDFQTLEYSVSVSGRKTKNWTQEITFHNGANKKQDKIRILNSK